MFFLFWEEVKWIFGFDRRLILVSEEINMRGVKLDLGLGCNLRN